jgi:hypothetical protein
MGYFKFPPDLRGDVDNVLKEGQSLDALNLSRKTSKISEKIILTASKRMNRDLSKSKKRRDQFSHRYSFARERA